MQVRSITGTTRELASLPWPRTKRIDFHHDYLGPEHLVRGVMREASSPAARGFEDALAPAHKGSDHC